MDDRAGGLPLVRLAGTPREIGRSLGEATADLVAHNLDLYFARFATEARLPRREVLRRAERHWPLVREQCEEFAVMAEGLAEGARQPLPEVAALNLRYELLYSEFSRIGQEELGGVPSPAGECTAFAVLPDASADRRLLIGQNWDWIPGVAGVLAHVTRPDGLRVFCFTEAGIAGGKLGMNSEGLGLVINGLLSNEDDWSRPGRPFHARTWAILTSRTLDQAIEAAARGERACSANFLMAQAGAPGEGRAVDVEAAPRATCQYRPSGGVLAHANHFLDPDRLQIWQPLSEERRSTYHRCDRMERMLADAVLSGPLGLDAAQSMLRDHDGHPESVCRHPNPERPASERYETVMSIIMDLHGRRALAAAGPPCTHAYHEYAL